MSKYCNNCDTKINFPPPRFCSKCGITQNPSKISFCSKCGFLRNGPNCCRTLEKKGEIQRRIISSLEIH